ncbi:MAG: FkbM family methyltransferase [Roseicyclus sp.]|nr:FkbM family methyltransferase [Roseicyclus sp.]
MTAMLVNILYKLERVLSLLQGKGWGAGTTAREFRQLQKVLGPARHGIFVDIGGHRGTYSEQILAQAPAARIVLFEPSAVNHRFLAEKFKGSAVTVEPFAVSDTAGDMILHANSEGSSLASLNKRNLDHIGLDFEHEESVTAIRFEDYWKEQLGGQPIDACKIDVEGHELSVLEGFGEAIKSVSVVQFEFGGTNIDSRTYLRDFWLFFERHGFDLYRITPFGPHKLNRYREGEENFSITNFLARNRRLDDAT